MGARKQALAVWGHECLFCGETAVVEVHHITPRCSQGGDEIGNLLVLCPTCHAKAERGLVNLESLGWDVLERVVAASRSVCA